MILLSVLNKLGSEERIELINYMDMSQFNIDLSRTQLLWFG